MDIENPLIKWHFDRFHRLVQRECRAGMIQTTQLVHHMCIERRRDLPRHTIVHRPHRANHRTESSTQHRRREVDHLVQILFVPGRRMRDREIREFRLRQLTPDDPLDCKLSIVQHERGLDWLFPIRETMTREVDPFVLAELLDDSRHARFLSIYPRECGKAVDTLTDVVQFRADRGEFRLVIGFSLANGDKMFPLGCRVRWIAPSSTNQSGQSWGVG